jgi:2-polyprenyl-6-methoxyphenol hydroxylase-like FAD-dependent oxidoreductase
VTRVQVAVVGGGPAGLAVAIDAATRGLSVAVLERQRFPVDKACGEGLMPAGRQALERLGVLRHLDGADCAPFSAIRYVQEDGRWVDGLLEAPGGLGVRRLALSTALAARAREAGVVLLEGAGVRSQAVTAGGVSLATDQGPVEAELLVAADGLHSPTRRALGLEVEARGPRRFGLRRHYRLAPWADRVEVHFAPGVEAYLTPAGAARIGLAFLWRDGALPGRLDFPGLLARFPALEARLGNADFDSEARGAGPLRQAVRARALGRVVLLGDAAGSVDAITGEGLSLALEASAALAACLPAALAAGGGAAAFAPYELAAARAFARYARLAGALVWVAGHPRLRRLAVDRLIARPALFAWALRRATGHSRAPSLAPGGAGAHPSQDPGVRPLGVGR